eukprot:m.213081 g.213081  ORF g.213081 m.213081 type:complete len:390 (-) comp22892_c0_seq1:346-1515(-)
MACICGADGQEESDARKRSLRISQALVEEGKRQHKEVRLLLLGAGESGKTTIVKQLQIIHGHGLQQSLKDNFRVDLLRNVAVNMAEILNAMEFGERPLTPALTLSNPKNLPHAKAILELAQGMTDYERDRLESAERLQTVLSDSNQFVEQIDALWADAGVKAAFHRSPEFQLSDNAEYFFTRLKALQAANFEPTQDDAIRVRNQTSGVSESTFVMAKHTFRIVDVGGQRQERPKWIQCFSDVTAIIWVASSSGFDLFLREDGLQNRLVESLTLFESVWKNRFLRNVSIILFLNKTDILEEKMKRPNAGKRLKQFFGKYSGSDELKDAMSFLLQQFEDIVAGYKSRDNTEVVKQLYCHFTCAVDTQNITRVFDACRDIIMRLNLGRLGLL